MNLTDEYKPYRVMHPYKLAKVKDIKNQSLQAYDFRNQIIVLKPANSKDYFVMLGIEDSPNATIANKDYIDIGQALFDEPENWNAYLKDLR